MSIFGAMFAPDQPKRPHRSCCGWSSPAAGSDGPAPRRRGGNDVQDGRRARPTTSRSPVLPIAGHGRAPARAVRRRDLRAAGQRRIGASRSAPPTTTSSSSAPTSARRWPTNGSGSEGEQALTDDLGAFLEAGEHRRRASARPRGGDLEVIAIRA